MRRNVRTIVFSVFLLTILLTFVSVQLYRADQISHSPVNLAGLSSSQKRPFIPNLAISKENDEEEEDDERRLNNHRSVQQRLPSLYDHDDDDDRDVKETVSVLLPDWIVLVIVSPGDSTSMMNSGKGDESLKCVFEDKSSSPARFSGILPSGNRTLFKCVLPYTIRRRLPFTSPVLMKSDDIPAASNWQAPVMMMRWSFLAYDSFSTESDVVVFAKGVNNRQGINRLPETLNCVFGDDIATGARTTVTSSAQEVFRCPHPVKLPENLDDGSKHIKISLEIISEENKPVLVPSVAYYTPQQRTLAKQEKKSEICACTMVYNVAKFLREWVIYHSSIGIEKFILYDNDSEDDLSKVVEGLVNDGYDVKTLSWLWPKTQEAGFSHSTLYAKDSCKWMIYLDVDEFVFSPSWLNLKNPSPKLLSAFTDTDDKIGQVSIFCNEFGPSNQSSNPINGVTQGYTCRRRQEQRHKSLVLLDAVHPSLSNVVHHFALKDAYKWKKASMGEGIVNHYKYQAWDEFKVKFRRRVSAYVVDWTQAVNPTSNDRTPGLGFAAVEPEGWAMKFCEVRDFRMKELTQQWFADTSLPADHQLAWRRRTAYRFSC